MGAFENQSELDEAEREGWLKAGVLTESGHDRLVFEVGVSHGVGAAGGGVDPREVGCAR